MSFPAFIVKAVVIAGITVVYVEPVSVLIIAVSDFYEFAEFSADMIEYAIKNNLYSVFM